jgi:hypothetical protein
MAARPKKPAKLSEEEAAAAADAKARLVRIEHLCYCAHQVHRTYISFLGENLEPTWGNMSPDTKASLRDAVGAVIDGTTDPKALHERWLRYRKANGWKLGKARDKRAKVDPFLVAWEELPLWQQTKAKLIIAVVLAIDSTLPTLEV